MGSRERDIDLAAGTVTISVPSEIKGKRERKVDLSSQTKTVLAQQLLERPPEATFSGIAFPNGDGGSWNLRNFRERVFKPALKPAGLPEDLHLHDLRHTYAALMVRAGAHAKYLQAQMGHSSIQVTLDKYGHLFPDANRGVLDALDDLVRGDGARG